MTKPGDMPVSLVLTRDQVRMLRMALSTTDYVPPVPWDFVKSMDLRTALDSAETLSTIDHARRLVSCSCARLASDHMYCAVHGHI